MSIGIESERQLSVESPMAVTQPARISVIGVPLDVIGEGEMFDYAVQAASGNGARTVMYLNIHVCNTAVSCRPLMEAMRRADLVYCDGEGVRQGARILGYRLPPRLTAAGFMPQLAAACVRHDLSIYFLGGREGVAEEAVARLKERCPGLKIAGKHHGYFHNSRDRSGEIIEQVNEARPDILFVGMGTPLEQTWVHAHRKDIRAPVVWCFGAAMDYIAGRTRRAPAWMRNHGMEWLYRLCQEPCRLFARYVFGNPLFMTRVLMERMKRRRQVRGH